MENVMSRMESYEGKKTFKVPGLGLQIDVVMWIIVVLIIVAIVLGVGYHLRESARIASTKVEMDQIRNAILEYEGLRIDGALPASLEVLMQDECIKAADSIDGIAHGNFLPNNSSRWNVDGKVKDLWNNAYKYTYEDADTRTGEIISSGGHGTDYTTDDAIKLTF